MYDVKVYVTCFQDTGNESRASCDSPEADDVIPVGQHHAYALIVSLAFNHI